MLGQFWMVSGRNRYYTFPKYVRFYGSLHLWKGHKKILYCEFPGVWNHSASNPGSVTLNRTNPSPIKITACCSTLRTDFHTDHVFQFKQVFRSSGFFSRVNGTKGTVPQSPWSLFPSSSSILQNFVHLCCIGLTSGSTYSWLHSSQLCRQRHSVHSVLLIVQPQECADDAGFTLVQSHCCTLPSGPVSLSCSPSAIFTS